MKVRDKHLTVYCRRCPEIYEISVDPDDYRAWKTGTLIQDAFPYLSADEREILISGICSVCFDNLFKEN